MKSILSLFVAVAACSGMALRGAEQPGSEAFLSVRCDVAPEVPKIQMAILLDTSGSMEGLINQARTQLWKIVNDLARTKRHGMSPRFEVALYEYGKSSLPASEGFLQQIVPMTDNLDLISEKLFELQTNGGQEYCGWVIQDAVRNLEWSKSNNDLKMIFIAGNEPFTQGPVDFRISCKEAVEKGITVNTIHCGGESEGRQGQWAEGAALADGSFMNINQNAAAVEIATPYDKKLIELSGKLNTTYLGYGDAARRREFSARQSAQDSNAAAAAPSSGANRALSKSSGLYRNAEFDLVDGLNEGKVKLEELPKDQLPEGLRKLSDKELAEHVAKKANERKQVQDEIKKLSVEREKYLASERAKSAEPGADTLDDAVLKAVRNQATTKGFEYVQE